MSPRLLLMVSLLALSGLGCRDQGAVKLTVSFPDFKPGCIRVGVQTEDGPSPERTVDVLNPTGTRDRDTLTGAIYRESGWSNPLRVTVTSFEHECSGEGIETRITTVSVEAGQVAEVALTLEARDKDGDGYAAAEGSVKGTDCDDNQGTVHPEQTELCNDRDDNCDGARDEGLHLAEACQSALGCAGVNECALDGSVTCKQTQSTSIRYPDQDNDGYGVGVGEPSCQPVVPGFGYASVGGDCDDTRTNVNPGAPERCDNLDNNCDQKSDTEVFALGTACDDITGCGGKKACAPDGSVSCAGADTPASTYYPDEDGDNYGRAGASQLFCEQPAGYVSDGTDCNDGNSFTHPGATELCDQEDNNCGNGTMDEVTACLGGGPRWAEESSQGMDSWRSVSRWSTEGVWVVGGGKYEVRRPGQTSFASPTIPCQSGLDLNAVWANRSTGAGKLGGNSGFIAEVSSAGACGYQEAYATNIHVQGMTGVLLTGTTYLTHLVGIHQTQSDRGRMAWTNGSQAPSFQDVDRPVFDVHGIDQGVVFAVGGHAPTQGSLGGEPRIYRYTTGAQPWTAETIQGGTTPVVKNVLRGVWVVNPRLAFAVGDGGSVLVWDGKIWAPYASPGTMDLLSVLSFGRQALYVTTRDGKVLRYRDSAWSTMTSVTPARALNDIAGTSPEDLWVVGEQGTRLHWTR